MLFPNLRIVVINPSYDFITLYIEHMDKPNKPKVFKIKKTMKLFILITLLY